MARRRQCTLGDRAEVRLLCRAFHIFLSTREMYCLANHLMEMCAQSVAAAAQRGGEGAQTAQSGCLVLCERPPASSGYNCRSLRNGG